jgi:penicillin amidase
MTVFPSLPLPVPHQLSILSPTVNVGGYDFDTLEQSGGPSYRQVLDISNWEASLFVHPMGQSGNVFSSHFDDLLPLWTKGQYLEMKSINYPSHATLTLLPEAEEPSSEPSSSS